MKAKRFRRQLRKEYSKKYREIQKDVLADLSSLSFWEKLSFSFKLLTKKAK